MEIFFLHRILLISFWEAVVTQSEYHQQLVKWHDEMKSFSSMRYQMETQKKKNKKLKKYRKDIMMVINVVWRDLVAHSISSSSFSNLRFVSFSIADIRRLRYRQQWKICSEWKLNRFKCTLSSYRMNVILFGFYSSSVHKDTLILVIWTECKSTFDSISFGRMYGIHVKLMDGWIEQ